MHFFGRTSNCRGKASHSRQEGAAPQRLELNVVPTAAHSALCAHTEFYRHSSKRRIKQGTAYLKHRPRKASPSDFQLCTAGPSAASPGYFNPCFAYGKAGRGAGSRALRTPGPARTHGAVPPLGAASRAAHATPLRAQPPLRPGAHLAAPGKPMAYSVTTTAPPRPRLCCSARRAPPTCRLPARPRSCQQSSAHCARPETSSGERRVGGKRGGKGAAPSGKLCAHTRLW